MCLATAPIFITISPSKVSVKSHLIDLEAGLDISPVEKPPFVDMILRIVFIHFLLPGDVLGIQQGILNPLYAMNLDVLASLKTL